MPVLWTTRLYSGGPDRIRTGIVHYGYLFRKQGRYGAMVRPVGIEPTWCGLKVRCQTTRRQAHILVAGLRIELNCAGL